MTIEFGLTNELVNTSMRHLRHSVHYQRNLMLEPINNVQIPMRERDFAPPVKLIQVLLSILADCVTFQSQHQDQTRTRFDQDMALGSVR